MRVIMLVLMCAAGENRYAIDCSHVVEVVSCVQFEPVVEAPDWVAGVFAYRGRATPLVDLRLLTAGVPCARRWNSRIMVTRLEGDNVPQVFGLLAERVTTAEVDAQPSSRAAAGDSEVSGLGPMLLDDQGMFQLLSLSRLFAADRRTALQSVVSEDKP
jgi:chemotaxis-related protein WspB